MWSRVLNHITVHRESIRTREHGSDADQQDTMLHSSEREKTVEYYLTIRCYFIYVIYGLLGGIYINAITSTQPVISDDMLFNMCLSPVIYFHSPRNILTNIHGRGQTFWLYYTVPFVTFLHFRLLSRIEGLNTFVLNPKRIHTPLQIGLTVVLGIGLLCIMLYYLYISSNPLVNLALSMIGVLVIGVCAYSFSRNGGSIHIHHFFLGAILMLVSKNYHSHVVIVVHSASYALYIEGISIWGFDPIAWTDSHVQEWCRNL